MISFVLGSSNLNAASASNSAMNVKSTRYTSYALGVVSNKPGYERYYGTVTVEVRSNAPKGTLTRTSSSAIGGSYVNGYPKAGYVTISARAQGAVAGYSIWTTWE